MDESKVYKRKDKNGIEQNIFRHNKIFNLRIETKYIDHNYTLDFEETNHMSKTGLITLFQITSKNLKQPSFNARWDERDNQVDIDITNVNKNTYQLFKNGKEGYSGHHSKLKIESPRLYISEIRIPEILVFSGTITFNINYGHAPNAFI